MDNLTKEYHNLMTFITDNPDLNSQWAEFFSALDSVQRHYISIESQRHSDILPLTFTFKGNQGDLYRKFYDKLPDRYKHIAAKSFGAQL